MVFVVSQVYNLYRDRIWHKIYQVRKRRRRRLRSKLDELTHGDWEIVYVGYLPQNQITDCFGRCSDNID